MLFFKHGTFKNTQSLPVPTCYMAKVLTNLYCAEPKTCLYSFYRLFNESAQQISFNKVLQYHTTYENNENVPLKTAWL